MTTTLWIVGTLVIIISGLGLVATLKASSEILTALSAVLRALFETQKGLDAGNDTLSCTRNCKERRTATELIRMKQVNIGRKAWEEETKKQVKQSNIEAAESAKDAPDCRLTTFCGGDGDE